MDPMQKLERAIKIMIAMISLAGISFLGLRIYVGKSFRVDPARDCVNAGRVYDTARKVCLPP
jgi:hypothetical protein